MALDIFNLVENEAEPKVTANSKESSDILSSFTESTPVPNTPMNSSKSILSDNSSKGDWLKFYSRN